MIQGSTHKGFITFQRRKDGSVNFNRNWEDYKNGFGDLDGEFWLGNENLHKLTHGRNMEMRIWAQTFGGVNVYTYYNNVSIENEENNYRLNGGVYSSGKRYSPDDWIARSANMDFSTFDRDNDIFDDHCAQLYNSGWWMSACFYINLNGPYQPTEAVSGYAPGIIWYGLQGMEKSLKQCTMSIRSLD